MRFCRTALFLLFTTLTAAFGQQHKVKQKVIVLGKDAAFSAIDIVLLPVQGGSFNFNHLISNPGLIVRVNSFYIGKYEITQAQWTAVMHDNPSIHTCNNCPVNNVSWEQVQDFITALDEQTGDHYRLPTEAEWEFAARGGVLSKHYTYSGSNDLNEVAWYKDNSDGYIHPVGEKKPNELGLYDMTGNVDEWCSDWDGYMKSLPINPDNPKGPPDGGDKIYRGGNFETSETDQYPMLQFQWNGRSDPFGKDYNIGFRLARDYP